MTVRNNLSITEQLMQSLKFTNRDLEANQQGLLSETQRNFIWRKQTQYTLFAGAVMAVGLLCIALYLGIEGANMRPAMSEWLAHILRVLTVFVALPVFMIFLWAQYRTFRTIKQGMITSITGPLVRHRRRHRGHTTYLVEVANKRFIVQPEVYETLVEGKSYTLYYPPRMGILLSAEQHTDTTERQKASSAARFKSPHTAQTSFKTEPSTLQLMALLGFNQQELEENQKGILTDSQRLGIGDWESRSPLWNGGVMVFVIFMLIFIVGAIVGGGDISRVSSLHCMSMGVIMAIVMLPFVIGHFREAYHTENAVQQGTVVSVTGRVRLERSGDYESTFVHHLLIADIRFLIQKEIYNGFTDGDIYTLHYVPQINIIVSAEHHTEGIEQQRSDVGTPFEDASIIGQITPSTELLMSRLAFTHHDLEENRHGVLSDAQRARVGDRKPTSALFSYVMLALMAFGLGVTVLLGQGFPNIMNTLMVMQIGIFIFLVPLAVVDPLYQRRVYKAIQRGKVVSATGPIRLKLSNRNSSRLSYSLITPEKTFQVNSEIYSAFIDGSAYTLYYIPGTTILLSAEHHPEEDKKQKISAA